MQALSQIVDLGLLEPDLSALGARLALPHGWQNTVRTLEEALVLTTTEGEAVVIQDELANTYPRR